jgi:hypothetical protein
MARAQGGNGCGALLVIALALFLVGKCSGSSDPSDDGLSNQAASLTRPAFIRARSLNCRETADARSSIVETIGRATEVVVVEEYSDRSKLDRIGTDCWVSTEYLSETSPGSGGNGQGLTSASTRGALATAGVGGAAAGAYLSSRKVGRHTGAKTYRAKRRVNSGRRSRAGRSGRRGGGSYLYDGGNCPCSGSNICIGPRGGRYCITSGGNKRYGV